MPLFRGGACGRRLVGGGQSDDGQGAGAGVAEQERLWARFEEFNDGTYSWKGCDDGYLDVYPQFADPAGEVELIGRVLDVFEWAEQARTTGVQPTSDGYWYGRLTIESGKVVDWYTVGGVAGSVQPEILEQQAANTVAEGGSAPDGDYGYWSAQGWLYLYDAEGNHVGTVPDARRVPTDNERGVLTLSGGAVVVMVATHRAGVTRDSAREPLEQVDGDPVDWNEVFATNLSRVRGVVAPGGSSSSRRIPFILGPTPTSRLLLGEGHAFSAVRAVASPESTADGFVTFQRNRMSANQFTVEITKSDGRGSSQILDVIRDELQQHVSRLAADGGYPYGDDARVKYRIA